MRPAGEIRGAILQAARDLTTADRAPTVQELAARACVGALAALHTVRNMKRAGQLEIARTRAVAHRNRPVAEYAPAKKDPPQDDEAYIDVSSIFSIWAQG